MVDDGHPDGERCPDCGSTLRNTIAYSHGHRTSDGWECTECEWWCFFGEEPW